MDLSIRKRDSPPPPPPPPSSTSAVVAANPASPEMLTRYLPQILEDSSAPSVEEVHSLRRLDEEASYPQLRQQLQQYGGHEKKAAAKMCQVCHLLPCKHNHYGGQVCSSCRGFFRRAVMNDRASIIKCATGKKNCPINSKSRRSCSWCRYAKCLSAGMRPEWIMTTEERKARRAKIIEQKEEEAKAAVTTTTADAEVTVTVTPKSEMPRELPVELTNEEQLLIEQALSSGYHAFFNSLCDILIVDASPILTLHDAILLEKPVKPAFIKLFEHSSRYMFRSAFSRLVRQEDIHPDDHDHVVGYNFGPFFSCLVAAYLNPMDFAKIVENMFLYMRERRNEDEVFQMVEDLFRQVANEGKIPGIQYDQVLNRVYETLKGLKFYGMRSTI